MSDDELKALEDGEEVEIIDDDTGGSLSDGERYDSDEPLVDEDIRARRRKERQERRERRNTAIARDKTELRFLQSRNEELERRMAQLESKAVSQDVNSIDTQLKAAQAEFQAAEKVMAQSMSEGNGEEAAVALRYRDQAAQKAMALEELKRRAVAYTQAPKQPQVDQRIVQNFNEFVKRNSWFDPNGSNEESLIAMAVDKALTAA